MLLGLDEADCTKKSDNGVDNHRPPSLVHALNSSPPAWGVNDGRKRKERGEEGRGEGVRVFQGITLLNRCRPQLGALSRSQGVAGCKSPRGDSQAPASPPLSSVHLSPSPSHNPPGGTPLPPSTFFLPPLPSGGAGEVVSGGGRVRGVSMSEPLVRFQNYTRYRVIQEIFSRI